MYITYTRDRTMHQELAKNASIKRFFDTFRT
jgi:hypothetical protein